MTTSAPLAFDLFGTFVHIKHGGHASTVEVTETFWKELASSERPDLNDGWLVAAFHMTRDSAKSAPRELGR